MQGILLDEFVKHTLTRRAVTFMNRLRAAPFLHVLSGYRQPGTAHSQDEFQLQVFCRSMCIE